MVALFVELTDTIVKNILPIIAKTIRVEMSALVLKILLGIIISSILIFSIFQIAIHYVTWLEPIQGEGASPILVFSLLGLSCLGVLYFLFKNKESKNNVPVPNDSTMSLFLVFGQGFLDGYQSHRKGHQHHKS